MIPREFSLDVVERSHKLLTALESYPPSLQSKNSGEDLSATFLLSMAMPLLVIPIEGRKDKNDSVTQKIGTVSPVRFEDAPFFVPDCWNLVVQKCKDFPPPFTPSDGTKCSAGHLKTATVLDYIRNALAHGAVAYLAADFTTLDTNPAEKKEVAAFALRSGNRAKKPDEFYLFFITQNNFRMFLDKWAEWLLS